MQGVAIVGKIIART